MKELMYAVVGITLGGLIWGALLYRWEHESIREFKAAALMAVGSGPVSKTATDTGELRFKVDGSWYIASCTNFTLAPLSLDSFSIICAGTGSAAIQPTSSPSP